MKTLISCLIFVFSFSGFAQPQISTDLYQEVVRATHYIEGLKIEDKDLDVKLNQVYSLVFNLNSGHFNLNLAGLQAKFVVQALWQLRLTLHGRIEEMFARDLLLKDYEYGARLVRSARNVSRAARYMEDMIGELIGLDYVAKNLELKGFEGGPLHVLVNPKYQNVNYRSGDIITVRGGVFNSAAIARIGDTDSQFSHQAMVYENPDTHEKFIVESVIAEGGRSYPFDEFLSEHSGSRLAVFRFKGDPQIAHKAAEIMYRTVNKKKYPYNFSMDLDNESKLFCTQISYLGYLKASNGSVKLNLFPTVMSANYKQFFNDIGVTAKTTYAPGDIELDPRFEIVAEWRNFANTRSLRNKDLILTKIFSWMDSGQLKYRVTPTEWALGKVISSIRGIPLVGGAIPYVKKAAAHQSARSLSVVTSLQRVGSILEEAIEDRQEELKSQRQPEMYPREILEFLENYIQKNGDEFSKWVK